MKDGCLFQLFQENVFRSIFCHQGCHIKILSNLATLGLGNLEISGRSPLLGMKFDPAEWKATRC